MKEAAAGKRPKHSFCLLLASKDRLLMVASFQQERFYRQEAHRYVRLSEVSGYIYVLSAADTGFVRFVGSFRNDPVIPSS